MEIRECSFYQDFRCVAGACAASCCFGWRVPVDDDTLALYHKEKGLWGFRLSRATKELRSVECLRTRFCRCIFHDGQRMCSLQKKKGVAYMPKICRDFPRVHDNYGAFAVATLDLACPEAGRLFLEACGYEAQGEENPAVAHGEAGGEECPRRAGFAGEDGAGARRGKTRDPLAQYPTEGEPLMGRSGDNDDREFLSQLDTACTELLSELTACARRIEAEAETQKETGKETEAKIKTEAEAGVNERNGEANARTLTELDNYFRGTLTYAKAAESACLRGEKALPEALAFMRSKDSELLRPLRLFPVSIVLLNEWLSTDFFEKRLEFTSPRLYRLLNYYYRRFDHLTELKGQAYLDRGLSAYLSENPLRVKKYAYIYGYYLTQHFYDIYEDYSFLYHTACGVIHTNLLLLMDFLAWEKSGGARAYKRSVRTGKGSRRDSARDLKRDIETLAVLSRRTGHNEWICKQLYRSLMSYLLPTGKNS